MIEKLIYPFEMNSISQQIDKFADGSTNTEKRRHKKKLFIVFPPSFKFRVGKKDERQAKNVLKSRKSPMRAIQTEDPESIIDALT